jgi:ABC-2 type transport system ATP-binding protein
VEIRKRIGYLAQDPRYYEHMTARQTLRYTARFFYRGPKDLIEARVAEMLELVGLEDKADRPVKGFSGGERQRLGIAQAQVNYPDLLILDEPAASLDPMGRHDVLAVMEKLRKYTTIFYSTHILEDVQRVSDTVAILDRGKLIAEAPITELLAGDGCTAIYALILKGNVSQAQARLASQPWVQDLSVSAQDGLTNWQVSVTDDNTAEDQMLRMILEDRGVQVKHFGRKTYNLEEVFMNLVGKEDSK